MRSFMVSTAVSLCDATSIAPMTTKKGSSATCVPGTSLCQCNIMCMQNFAQMSQDSCGRMFLPFSTEYIIQNVLLMKPLLRTFCPLLAQYMKTPTSQMKQNTSFPLVGSLFFFHSIKTNDKYFLISFLGYRAGGVVIPCDVRGRTSHCKVPDPSSYTLLVLTSVKRH